MSELRVHRIWIEVPPPESLLSKREYLRVDFTNERHFSVMLPQGGESAERLWDALESAQGHLEQEFRLIARSQWKSMAIARLGMERDRMQPEAVRAVQAFLEKLP